MHLNIFLPDTSASYPYERPGGGGEGSKRPSRVRQEHAGRLLHELDDAFSQTKEDAEQRGGTYLKFNSSPGFSLDPDGEDPSSVGKKRKVVVWRHNQ